MECKKKHIKYILAVSSLNLGDETCNYSNCDLKFAKKKTLSRQLPLGNISGISLFAFQKTNEQTNKQTNNQKQTKCLCKILPRDFSMCGKNQVNSHFHLSLIYFMALIRSISLRFP